MEDTVRTSTFVRRVVRNPDAAAVFAKPLDLRYLSPFIGRTRLASEVARELGVPLTTLAYRVKKLLELGLLEVTRTETRSGSPLKYLRATSDAFFVPFEATDAETLEALLEQWEKPWLAMFHRGYAYALNEAGPTWGIGVWRDETGEVRVAPQQETGQSGAQPALDELVLNLRLSPEEAQSLQQELLGIIQRYSGREGRTHFLRVILTPLSEGKVLL